MDVDTKSETAFETSIDLPISLNIFSVRRWSGLTSSLADEAPVPSYQHISQPVPPGSLQTEEVSTAGCGFSESLYETETKNYSNVQLSRLRVNKRTNKENDRIMSSTFIVYCEL